MKTYRRHLILLIVLAAAVAPLHCVCATWAASIDGAAHAGSLPPSDCHPLTSGTDPDNDCGGCDDGSPATLYKSDSGPWDIGFAPGASNLATFRIQHRDDPPRAADVSTRRSTPITLKVVLLS